MWNNENTFKANLGYAMRMVISGHATPEQAAAICGLSVGDLQALLASCPQPQLQEVTPSSHTPPRQVRRNAR